MNWKLYNRHTYSVAVMALFVLILSAGSCAKKPVVGPDPDPDPDPTGEVTNADINRWVLDSMKYWYYWNTSIPNSPNLNQSPEAFFESILKRPDDRFSWIQNNEDLRNQLSGVIKTSGLAVAYYLFGNNPNRAFASVRYVLKGSPADQAGVKRGDLFLEVNGNPFTVSDGFVTNAGILSGNDTFTLTKGVLNDGVISEGGTVTLTPVENFQEKAIHLDTVLTTPNGTKVAYLFYNRFLQNQAQDLVNAFNRFKAMGVTELIVDERYNSGGSVSVAGLLSALIHRDFNINSPFIQYKFNNNLGHFYYTYGQVFGAANASVVSANNLGLNRVFILATGSSASASELLINNLFPFLGEANVIHIGATTRGKDDASITISNSSSRFKDEYDWGIQPIVLKYTNSLGVGDFVNGLVPKYEERESVPFAPMGSFEDPLIGRALTIIDPSLQAVYGKTMSIQRSLDASLNIRQLEQFNNDLGNPRPLDVTETLKGKTLKLY